MLKVIVLIALICEFCDAGPGAYFARERRTAGTIQAPPNCPPGTRWENGSCRVDWDAPENQKRRLANTATVPPNCPVGQSWGNGRCREIQENNAPFASVRGVQPANIVTVPPNCPAGQEYVNGQCREIWLRLNSAQNYENSLTNVRGVQPANVATAPPNCPEGQEYVNGECREIWLRYPSENSVDKASSTNSLRNVQPSNIVTVPPNCPEGQEYVNGQCREIWLKKNASPKPEYSNPKMYLYDQIVAALKGIAFSGISVDYADNSPIGPTVKNIVTVPSQCPDGYKPDVNGICREIWSRRREDIPTIKEEQMHT